MKPSIPRGTRDFGPAEMQKRNHVLGIIRNNFELFAYQPIETPAMENISTLTGKYGEEGDKLIFKILNSGDYLAHIDDELMEKFSRTILKRGKLFPDSANRDAFFVSKEGDLNALTKEISEKALRYDLTVPFARFVVMNQSQLSFPFKRYQIQPVWRADRPQKGRYREFYQCDADVIGSDSLINELELIALMDKTFSELNIPVLLKFNNRKILTALSEIIEAPDKITDLTVAIDKLDKIGKDGVNKELAEKGLSEKAIHTLQPLLDFKGSNAEKVSVLSALLGENEQGKKGLEEINHLLAQSTLHHATLELDITLARGLNYYTGSIFEVKANAGTFTPSILGGGRYDNLTGVFGLPNMSGVGISFGIDRICDVMEELALYPANISNTAACKVLFAHFDDATRTHCLALVSELRQHGISCEVYPDLTKKLGKQFDYANKKNVPYVCTVGSNEITAKKYALKNMRSGEQQQLSINEVILHVKKSDAL